MAHLTDRIRIARPVEEVFDFIADSRNEPAYNPDMRTVTLLTGEPIGTGTRFQATMGRGGMELLVTLTTFDRPHVLGSVTTSSLLDTAGTLTFSPDGDTATVMAWDWQVTPQTLVATPRPGVRTGRTAHGTAHLDRRTRRPPGGPVTP